MSLWGLGRALFCFDSEMEGSWNGAGFQSRDMVSSDQDAPGHRKGREGSRAPPVPQTIQHSQVHMICMNNPPNPALTEK